MTMKTLGEAQCDAYGPDIHTFVPVQYPRVRPVCMEDGPLWTIWDLEVAVKRVKRGTHCPKCRAILARGS